MNQKMLDKITQLCSKATILPNPSHTTARRASQLPDSLGRVIRNSKEAQQFLEELNHAMKLAGEKNN